MVSVWIDEEDVGGRIVRIVSLQTASYVGNPRLLVLEVVGDGLSLELRVEAGDEGLAGEVLGEECDAVDGRWGKRSTVDDGIACAQGGAARFADRVPASSPNMRGRLRRFEFGGRFARSRPSGVSSGTRSSSHGTSATRVLVFTFGGCVRSPRGSWLTISCHAALKGSSTGSRAAGLL